LLLGNGFQRLGIDYLKTIRLKTHYSQGKVQKDQDTNDPEPAPIFRLPTHLSPPASPRDHLPTLKEPIGAYQLPLLPPPLKLAPKSIPISISDGLLQGWATDNSLPASLFLRLTT